MKSSFTNKRRIAEAVRQYWGARVSARLQQQERGGADVGSRSEVTSGRSMDGFRRLTVETIRDVSPDAQVHVARSEVVLPGYFRPTKSWDVLAFADSKLIAVVELKSLGGPSFGNNANNRCEEALGSGVDLMRQQELGRFGPASRPFVGYFILVEDEEGSRRPVLAQSHHFPVDTAFVSASHQVRLRILCERLMEQRIYSSAAVLVAPRPSGSESSSDGSFSNLSDDTSMDRFLRRLAAHVQAECG
jgi:type II restriction enzyme